MVVGKGAEAGVLEAAIAIVVEVSEGRKSGVGVAGSGEDGSVENDRLQPVNRVDPAMISTINILFI